jgi:SAM-dependent methyltransferase
MKSPEAKYTKEYWDNWASRKINDYDTSVRNFQYTAPEKMAGMVIPHIRERIEKPVIDVGCGTGLSGIHLINEGYVLDGIDHSPEMIKGARRRGYRNLVIADIKEKLDFNELSINGKDRYGTLITVGVYGEFAVPKDFINMTDLLAPECVVAVAGAYSELNEGGMENVLKNIGFTVVDEKPGLAYYKNGNRKRPVDYQFLVASR